MKISSDKVVIIGAGAVGSTIAYSLMVQGICSEIALVDKNMERAKGEAMDLQHGIEYQDRNVKVYADDYSTCEDADIVIITASIPMKKDLKDRMALLELNIKVMGDVVEQVMQSKFDGIIIVVSNPNDILSYYVYKKSGLPKAQVIGTGTSLETARLKKAIGDIIDLDPRSVNAFVLGEHGESMIVPWSLVQVGGKNIRNAIADNPTKFSSVDLTKIVDETSKIGFKVFERKGSTQFGIASATVGIVKSILRDEKRMISVSTYLDGEYGEKDIFCGVPSILGREGVLDIAVYHLDKLEAEAFKHSANTLRKSKAIIDNIFEVDRITHNINDQY